MRLSLSRLEDSPPPPARDYSVDDEQGDRAEDGGEPRREVEEFIHGLGIEQRSCEHVLWIDARKSRTRTQTARCSLSPFFEGATVFTERFDSRPAEQLRMIQEGTTKREGEKLRRLLITR
jgi:hypothetical protein